jgi:ATP-dependent protease ClpP protease subunit
MSKMPYFTMKLDDAQNAAEIYIFGDIAAYKWDESDVSAYDLAAQIKALPADADITIHINSNGGDLKEGLGIYNVLKGRNVTTICEGFAASSASVIFCAGKRRVMNAASLLFIHNASMMMAGTAEEMEKAAEDLRIITDAAKAAYREAGVNVSDEELEAMMDKETWITPQAAVQMGFATEIADEAEEGIQNSVLSSLMRVLMHKDAADEAKKTAESLTDAVERLRMALDELEKELVEDDAPAVSDEQDEAESAALEAVEEAAAESVEETATNSTPEPALVENKGFFGFR